MKNILPKTLFVTVILCLFQCSVYNQIYSDFDKSTDFSKYNTFAWLPDSGMTARTDSFRNTAYDNDVIRNNAKNFITHRLIDKGLQVSASEPDALFQLILLNEKKQRIVTYSQPFYPLVPGIYRYFPYYYNGRYYYPYYYPYYDYYTYYGWGCNSVYCEPYSYKQTYVKGTITINMFDRKEKKLVWTGSAEGNIYDPATVKAEVDPAIKKIMKTFPVKSRAKNSKADDVYAGR